MTGARFSRSVVPRAVCADQEPAPIDRAEEWSEHWARPAEPPSWPTLSAVAADLQRHGYDCAGPGRQVHAGENRVARLELADGGSIAVKIYRVGSWSRAALAAEHGFLADLDDAGVAVVRPSTFADGSSIAVLKDHSYAIYPWLDGIDRTNQVFSDDEIENLGSIAAAIHRVGRLGSSSHRRSMFPIDYCRGGTSFLLSSELVPCSVRAELARQAERIVGVLARRAVPDRCARIHGDLGPWNILWTGSGPVIIDFDDTGPGPPLQDLAQLTLGIAGDRRRTLDRLSAGYGEGLHAEPLIQESLGAIHAARRVHVSAWIASRWDDPAFRLRYPDFLQPSRWKRELTQMEQLLDGSARHAGAGHLPRKQSK